MVECTDNVEDGFEITDSIGLDAMSIVSGGVFTPTINSEGKAVITVNSIMVPDIASLAEISLEVTGVQQVEIEVYNGNGYKTLLQFVSRSWFIMSLSFCIGSLMKRSQPIRPTAHSFTERTVDTIQGFNILF